MVDLRSPRSSAANMMQWYDDNYLGPLPLAVAVSFCGIGVAVLAMEMAP